MMQIRTKHTIHINIYKIVIDWYVNDGIIRLFYQGQHSDNITIIEFVVYIFLHLFYLCKYAVE